MAQTPISDENLLSNEELSLDDIDNISLDSPSDSVILNKGEQNIQEGETQNYTSLDQINNSSGIENISSTEDVSMSNGEKQSGMFLQSNSIPETQESIKQELDQDSQIEENMLASNEDSSTIEDENLSQLSHQENFENISEPVQNLPIQEPDEINQDIDTQPLEENDSGKSPSTIFDFGALGINKSNNSQNEDTEGKEIIDFSYAKKQNKSKVFTNYSKISGIFNILTVILFFGIGCCIAYYLYMRYSLKENPTPQNTQYVEKLRKWRAMGNDYVAIDKTKNYEDVTIENDFERLIDANDIGYIDKKYILNQKMSTFFDKIITEKNKVEENKKNITKYAYLPKQITSVIGEEGAINSIEASLFALESIKFNSAVNVFVHMDSFVKNIRKSLNMSTSEIINAMNYIIQEGGKYINLYIQKCYLNPYEPNYDCEVIGDYDRYGRIFDTEKKIDPVFFKNLMYYIDLKLEKTNYPSFNIVFQRFDKNSDKITFTIDINTLKQDELELQKSGILDDPVVFIMDKLVNNLKKSRFIKGNDIKINSLNVIPKTLKVGTTEFFINTISKVFQLPIQKSTEREIYDFIEE